MSETTTPKPKAAPKPEPVDVNHVRRVGEARGMKFMLILNLKQALFALEQNGIHYGETCIKKEGDKHDMIGTGDPCWCGSDNCEVCLKCGLENHD